MKIRTVLLIGLIGFFTISACSQQRDDGRLSFDTLPLRVPENAIKPLRELVNIPLENKLKAQLTKNKKYKRLIDQKKMAVGLVDLRDPLNVKYARINGNVMMYAASLPKIAVLLAAEEAMERGELEETEEIKNDMRLMISKSDNGAATRMIDRLGFEKINQVLTDPKYDLYDEKFGGGLWVGKRYAKLGERYPDPMKGLSHAATVSQVCRYYYLLAYGKLVSYERSKEMLIMMESPDLHHKFVNSLDQVAPKARLFRKSGTWKNFHTDSALVWGPEGRRYIIVALIEDPEGEKICRNLIFEIEKVLKE